MWVTIGEIAQHNVGKTLNKGSRGSGAIREYITTSNLYWGSFDFTELRSMPIEEYELSKCSATKGDLLICEGGDAGRAAIWNYNYSICFQNHIHRVRPFGGISAKYLYYYMLYIYLNGNIKQYLKGVGIQSLSGNSLSSIVLPLPPIKEQQRIVNEIESLFEFIDTIEENKLSLEQFIAQAKSKILDLAIRGKLVPQEPEDEPASILLERIKTGKKSSKVTSDKSHYAHNLPRGWMLCKLGDVCLFKNGYAFKREDFTEEGVPLVRISNIKDNKIDLSTCKYIQSSIIDDKFTVKKGDLLIAMSGATTGKMGLYDLEEIAYLNQRVGNVRIVDLEVLLPEYRDYYMMAISSKILELAYGGAQPNISAQIIEAMALPLPPINEQKRIVSQIERIFAQLDIIENSLKA